MFSLKEVTMKQIKERLLEPDIIMASTIILFTAIGIVTAAYVIYETDAELAGLEVLESWPEEN